MKKVFLSVIGFSLLCRLNTSAQSSTDNGPIKPTTNTYSPAGYDTSDYRPRRLRLDEINLVSSFYNQTGDHSAVLGGSTTVANNQAVVDFSNGLDLKLVWFDEGLRKNTLTAGFGIDYHSSASSKWVALNGGGKPGGSRIYPSLDWTVENDKKGTSFGIGTYYSTEYNYESIGADLHYSAKTNDKMGEFGVKLQGYFDQVTQILPSEFVLKPPPPPPGSTTYTTASGNVVTITNGVATNSKNGLPSDPRTTLTAAFSYSQIINSRLQVMFLGDVVEQSGDLGLPFHRVYFSNGVDAIEKLPSNRFKLPLGVRLNYFLGDDIILRSYYRYYMDTWGIKANTANLEVAYKISPFFSISPFYRFYSQSAAKYFAPYEAHSPTDQYYTSNYEYSSFNSQFFGVGFRLAPPKGVFGIQNLHELELRYGHYSQTTDLASDVVSLSLGFK
jgi:Protein of unknown function (DUF3570)